MFDDFFGWPSSKGCSCPRLTASKPGPSLVFYDREWGSTDGRSFVRAMYGDYLSGRTIYTTNRDGCIVPLDRTGAK